MRKPMNGTKTHPLTQHAYAALDRLASGTVPRQEINAGVCDRLEREDLVEVVSIPSPYASHKNRMVQALRITDAGRAVRDARNTSIALKA